MGRVAAVMNARKERSLNKSERSAKEAEARAIDPGAWVPPDTPEKDKRRKRAREEAAMRREVRSRAVD